MQWSGILEHVQRIQSVSVSLVSRDAQETHVFSFVFILAAIFDTRDGICEHNGVFSLNDRGNAIKR